MNARRDGGSARGADPRRVDLERWDGEVADGDPFAGLKVDVAAYGHLDPLETLRGLSEASGVPVGALARYVLSRWAAGGNEALLELAVSGVDHLERLVAEAEAAGTDDARLAAYAGIRDVVTWLRTGVDGTVDTDEATSRRAGAPPVTPDGRPGSEGHTGES